MIRLLILIILLTGLESIASAHPVLTKTSFEKLPHWPQDDHMQALFAFQKSCVEINKRNSKDLFSHFLLGGRVHQWQLICAKAKVIKQKDRFKARRFFEIWFEPYHVKDSKQKNSLFTGYYLPLLQASFKPTKRFHVPIYGLPNDLIKVDLGLFNPELIGKSIVGQIKNHTLYPYPNRLNIEKNSFNKNIPVIAWGENTIDVYFAQIQGSAVIQLPNKKKYIIGYAGGNGRPYTSIGKILIEKEQLNSHTISMQSIRAWLRHHPKQINKLFNYNDSYVFFKILKNKHPLGTEKIPLTPERSLAIDQHFIPLGAPLWLETSIPVNNNKKLSMPFRHLLIAQDTGGAIKGVVRGDIYWGMGDKAIFIAGHMRSEGSYWILFPRHSV